MEAKLKQLKVAQLKEVLQQAGVAFKERDKKEELVAKILSNPKAASIANGNEQGPSAQAKASSAAAADDDLLAPPEDFDWDDSSPAVPATAAPAVASTKPAAASSTPSAVVDKPVSKIAAASTVSSEIPPPATEAAKPELSGAEAEDLEKRKARAARFGIPLVEKKAKPVKGTTKQKATAATEKSERHDGDDKLKAREARFGVSQATATNGKKRERSPIPVDPEEEQKRLRRAQKFSATQ